MNTPKQKRRHKPKNVSSKNSGKRFVLALENQEYALKFALILSEFEHLDSMLMPQVLWRLMGSKHSDVSGYIYRTLRNPSLKLSILKTLLERSSVNVHHPDQYDQILTLYEEVRGRRNDYAHGLWYTRDGDGAVFLAKRDDDGLAFFEAKEEPITALGETITKIRTLKNLIYETVSVSPEELRLLSSPQPPDAPTPS
ncbi:MAG: hypothetical protein ABL907_22895 [Hyphomicrobium sp.]